ncbi:oligosaccharide flippase family protein [Clostridiaceae bacterium DONG20-135]|uniref:Oligosaccharide flippase family protein n=2 Tax=Copranaerobaculum intestinale TaxID=2692629 RepID=A0A6N8U9C2_9FIRM|nr:oligosaccharide flippase family protein [Copranaerobaculum intestinale]
MIMSKTKQSIIAGGLITTAGIFISKVISIIYVVPFNAIIQTTENLTYYGTAYNIYSYVLNISISGFPFAVATMVSKYMMRGDYRTSLLVKRLASRLMIVVGAVTTLFLLLTSGIFAKLVVGPEYVTTMRNVLIVLSFALFFVAILSSMRGFYQGLNEMDIYAANQILEQISRVVFLLGMSALAVYVFHQERIWAVYFGVISTTVAAIFAIIQFAHRDKTRIPELEKLAVEQTAASNEDKRELIREMILIAVPYLLSAVLGYSDMIINTFFLPSGLGAFGMTSKEIMNITGPVYANINKLLSIPMVLAPGFSIAIIPYITRSLAAHDDRGVRKHISDCLDSVLYLALPISFCLFVFAKPIYYVMFGSTNLDLNAHLLSWFALEGFFSTVLPVINSLMMAGGLRKKNLQSLGVYTIVKLSITYILLAKFGFPGAVLSSVAAMLVCLLINAYHLSTRFHVRWMYTVRKFVLMLIGVLGIWAVAWGLQFIGFRPYTAGRIIGLIELGVSGLLAIAVYLGITWCFQLPQTIFHIGSKGKKHHV